MKTTIEDIELVIAYFNLRSSKQYTPAEIMVQKRVRKRFLAFGQQLLGTPERVILRRLISLCMAL